MSSAGAVGRVGVLQLPSKGHNCYRLHKRPYRHLVIIQWCITDDKIKHLERSLYCGCLCNLCLFLWVSCLFGCGVNVGGGVKPHVTLVLAVCTTTGWRMCLCSHQCAINTAEPYSIFSIGSVKLPSEPRSFSLPQAEIQQERINTFSAFSALPVVWLIIL